MTAQLCLEGDDVGAQQPIEHFLSPRQPGEQLNGRERNMQVEADGDVVPQVAQQSRYQLQLVILNPRHVTGVEGTSRFLSEPAVHLAIRSPPVPVILRNANRVVVQRPQGAVAETEVVAV